MILKQGPAKGKKTPSKSKRAGETNGGKRGAQVRHAGGEAYSHQPDADLVLRATRSLHIERGQRNRRACGEAHTLGSRPSPVAGERVGLVVGWLLSDTHAALVRVWAAGEGDPSSRAILPTQTRCWVAALSVGARWVLRAGLGLGKTCRAGRVGMQVKVGAEREIRRNTFQEHGWWIPRTWMPVCAVDHSCLCVRVYMALIEHLFELPMAC